MKKLFIKKPPLFISQKETISITLNRESVCLGDDIDSHEKEMEISSSISLSDLVCKLQDQYIPSVAGPISVWLLKINDVNICLFNQIGNSILCFNSDSKVIDNGANKVFLKYFAQKDINDVYSKISEENR